MNDAERISKLIGLAMSECSSSKLQEVRTFLVKAMRKLNETKIETTKAEQKFPIASFSGMSKDRRDMALRAIDEMIDSEKTKIADNEEKISLFG